MSNIPNVIREIFQPFENDPEFKQRAVEAAVKKYLDDHPDLSNTVRIVLGWEQSVWALRAGTPGENNSWGTYFGPSLSFGDVEYPDVHNFTHETIEYWVSRIDDCQHPRLKGRYADAAWDLSSKVNGVKSEHNLAYAAIDNYVKDIANPGITVEQIKNLERALFLAIKFNDQGRIRNVCDAMINFHATIKEKDKPRFHLFHFDAFFEQRKKVNLSDTEWENIVAGLEGVLQRKCTTDAEEFDPLFSRDIGQRLVRYYRSMNQMDDVQRIVRSYAAAIEHLTENAEPLFARHWLQEIHRDFVEAGMPEDAERIMPKIRIKGEQSKESMGTISHTTEISVEEMQKYCDAMTEGGVDQAMGRIAIEFLPRREELEQQLMKLTEDHPLLAMMGMEIGDEFTRARIGSVEDDETGRLVHQMNFSMAFNSAFLRRVMNRLFERYSLTPETFVEALYRSFAFVEDRKQILVDAIRYYREDGVSAAISMLIPQIECLFRNLLARIGGQTTYLDQKTKTYREKDLGTILNDPTMSQLWQKVLREEAALYFRVVLTEQRGLNLRNEVCHGLRPADGLRSQDADLLVHILLVLSVLRLREKSNVSEPASPK